MIELDPSCDTWMVLEINYQVGAMWFLLIVTLLKYILFGVTIDYIFE
jgi:hypothetical protein